MEESSGQPTPAKTPHAVRRFFRQTGPAGPMALITTCLPAVGAVFLFSFAPRIAPWVQKQGWLGVPIFVVALALMGGFALAPTYANSILGGVLFRFAVGFPAVMAGLAGTAMIGYTLAHRIVGHRVEDVIRQHPRWEIIRQALIGGSTRKTIGIIFLLRLSPLLPFETTNVLLAMCGVRPAPFLIGTMFGIAPRAAALVWAGSVMRKLELHAAPRPLHIVIGAIVTAVCIAVLALIGKHALDRACACRDDKVKKQVME